VRFLLLTAVRRSEAAKMTRAEVVGSLWTIPASRMKGKKEYVVPLSAAALEFKDSVKRIERGSRVLVAYADQTGGDEVGDLGLVHAACLAIIERSALVTTAFTVEGKQVMHVRQPYNTQVDTEDGTPPSIEQLIVAALRPNPDETAYWRAWPQRFDYVYLLFTEDEADNPAPDLLTQVYDGGRFQLYRVGKAHTAQSAPARGR